MLLQLIEKVKMNSLMENNNPVADMEVFAPIMQ
jgi:hypothetical protein